MIFVIVRASSWQPFQPSLMFAGKAAAYPTKAPVRLSTLGQASGLSIEL